MPMKANTQRLRSVSIKLFMDIKPPRGGLMSINNLIDTLLNLWVFAFMGILVWLYFKKESDGNKAESQKSNRGS